MKCVKKAREHLKTNVHDLSKEKEVLCSERVFKALDRRSKRRKVPEISPKRCNFKKKRVDQTSQPSFRAGASRWYGNRGGRQSI